MKRFAVFLLFVLERIKAVAREAGAKVDDSNDCHFNVEVLFTRTP